MTPPAEVQTAVLSERVGGNGAGPGELAVVLTGGGARGAYQVGILAWLAERFPDLELPIITGVSAGAVNAGHLAGHHGSFGQAVDELTGLWSDLRADHVFRVDAAHLAWNVLRWGSRLALGGLVPQAEVRAFLETEPLRDTLLEAYAAVDGELTGIDYNLHHGRLKAVAISTTSFTTGQSVVWVQGRNVEGWMRPMRRAARMRINVDHIMASAALPLFFPAVRIGNSWYGDGGIRLAAPLSPALHLGAGRILAISTRSRRTQRQADAPAIRGYPPPAQVFGVLMNAIFLDLIDQDALRLERINTLLGKLPLERREGMRIVQLMVMRPSRDLGRLSRAYEPRLPWAFRLLTRALGTRQTRSSDLLSMLMFQQDYLTRLIRMGWEDAEARADELTAFVTGEPLPRPARSVG